MRFNDNIYIAPGYTKEAFQKINLRINSDEKSWRLAVDIFKSRIEKRFLDKIDILLEQCDNEDAFAVMSLNCLLIETLAQFYEGKKDFNGCSKKYYTSFIRRNFDCGENIAEKFYTNVRCGILHSAQTVGRVVLCMSDEKIFSYNNDYLCVDVKRFTVKLKEIYIAYCRDLLDNKPNIRTNFIKKMNYISNR